MASGVINIQATQKAGSQSLGNMELSMDQEDVNLEDLLGPFSTSQQSSVLTDIVKDGHDDNQGHPRSIECAIEENSLASKVCFVSPAGRLCPSLCRSPQEGLNTWDDLHQSTIRSFVHADSSPIGRNIALRNSRENSSKKRAQDEELMSKLNLEEGNPSRKLGPSDFELLALVGQGGFAKVFQCQKKGTNDIYAMKVMTKTKIMEKNHGGYVKAERDILTKIIHPFIVQLHDSFQTTTKLYLILDFINGGHLFYHLYRQGTFSEDLARIYIAEIVCAVTYLHEMGIIHRDLKPENILLDANGHVKLTDFGLAKEVDDSTKSNSLCGTPQYIAPEILLAQGHGRSADWWSVGIILYEMLTGKPPFVHQNRYELQQKIVKDKIKLPKYLTSEAITLLKGLLQKDPSKRLGSGPQGSNEIKLHKWFKSINWRKIMAQEHQPKFRPGVQGVQCTANFDKIWTNAKLPLQDSSASTPKGESSNFFQRFTYNAPKHYLPGSDS